MTGIPLALSQHASSPTCDRQFVLLIPHWASLVQVSHDVAGSCVTPSDWFGLAQSLLVKSCSPATSCSAAIRAMLELPQTAAAFFCGVQGFLAGRTNRLKKHLSCASCTSCQVIMWSTRIVATQLGSSIIAFPSRLFDLPALSYGTSRTVLLWNTWRSGTNVISPLPAAPT